jgi:exodeoxyribonuclease VII large subunit
LGGALPRSLQLRHEKLERLAAGLSPRLLNEMLLRQQQRVQHVGAMLESLNVLSVLKRGFALVRDAGGKLIQSANMMPSEGTLSVQFHDGQREVVAGNAAPMAAPKPRSKKAPTRQPNLFGDE